MGNYFELFLMVLQGLSSSVVDAFFLMTALVALMTVYRFSQFGPTNKPSFKKAWGLVIEMVVQGILVGALFSFVVVFMGIPVMYSDYLYFLLPLSFIIGFYHIRFTSLNYAGLAMSFIALFMNGQTIGEWQIPNVDFSIQGIAVITGLLMVLVAGLILLTGDQHMMPIAVKTREGKKLGFGAQRFWPIPVVILAGLMVVVQGDTVAMPEWWPFLKLPNGDSEALSLFLMPLLFVMSYGSVSFSYSPQKQYKFHGRGQLISGVVLLLVGFLNSSYDASPLPSLIVMILVVVVPEVYWHKSESEGQCLYDLDVEGVYVVGVEHGTLAYTFGFRLGDLITNVSGEKVTTMSRLIQLYKSMDDEKMVVVHRAGAGEAVINVQRLDIIDREFGLSFMPDKPGRIFEYDQVTHMNMMNLMRMTVRKNDTD